MKHAIHGMLIMRLYFAIAIASFLYCSVFQAASAVEEGSECSAGVIELSDMIWMAIYRSERPVYELKPYANSGFFLEVESVDARGDELTITLKLAVFSKTKYVYLAHLSDEHNGILVVDFFGFLVRFHSEVVSLDSYLIAFKDTYKNNIKPVVIEQYSITSQIRQDTLRMVISRESLSEYLVRRFKIDPREPLRLALRPFIYLWSLEDYQEADVEEGNPGVYTERALAKEVSGGAFKEVWFDLLLDSGRFKVLDQDDSEELKPDDSDEPQTRE